MKEKKLWYQSKTKIASILIGISPILATIGALLNGSIDFSIGITQLTTEVGIVLGVMGIRDIELLRGKKG